MTDDAPIVQLISAQRGNSCASVLAEGYALRKMDGECGPHHIGYVWR